MNWGLAVESELSVGRPRGAVGVWATAAAAPASLLQMQNQRPTWPPAAEAVGRVTRSPGDLCAHLRGEAGSRLEVSWLYAHALGFQEPVLRGDGNIAVVSDRRWLRTTHFQGSCVDLGDWCLLESFH